MPCGARTFLKPLAKPAIARRARLAQYNTVRVQRIHAPPVVATALGGNAVRLLVRTALVAAGASSLMLCAAQSPSFALPTPAPTASPASTPAAAVTASPHAGPSAIPTPVPTPADEGQMSFDRFSDGATPQPGLFTVWRKHGRVFLEVAPAQLDRTFMVAPILASGLGEGLFSGIDFDTILVQFHRVGDAILVEAQNPFGKAREGSPQQRAVVISYPPSVLDAQAGTAVDRRTGGIVFSADLFLSDLGPERCD